MNMLIGVRGLARSASWSKADKGKEDKAMPKLRMVPKLIEEPGTPRRVVYVFEGGLEDLGGEDDE